VGWGVWANAAGSGVDGASARESAGTKEPQAGRAAVRTMSRSNRLAAFTFMVVYPRSIPASLYRFKRDA
jgi:hypothetical protein